MKKVQFKILRFNPEVDAKPYWQDFTLEIPEKSDMMLLKALHLLKEQDPTLTYRSSCEEAVCGSCGENINGQNGLACKTPISTLGDKIRVAPLPGFKIIRDLVVDMKDFFAQYEKVKPYLQNDEARPSKERLQSPEDRAKLDGLYECILCACCTSSCPSYWWNPEEFLGPAALLQADRWIEDSRDKKTKERVKDLGDRFKTYRCREIMNCATVCPKGLNPTQAINRIKDKILEEGI